MRRLLRFFKWLGLSLSTLLLLATGVLWVRSVGHIEQWRYDRYDPHLEWHTWPGTGQSMMRMWQLEVVNGRLWVAWETMAPCPQDDSGLRHFRQAFSADNARQRFESWFEPGERRWRDGARISWRFGGIGFWHGRDAIAPVTGRSRVELFHFAIPFWMLAIVFGLWPFTVTTRRLLRHKPHAPGHCQVCGYDLRATPDRCPECGTVPARSSAPAEEKSRA